VLQRACQQVAEWQRQFHFPLQAFVNVSGYQLADSQFPREVSQIVSESGLAPRSLGLEITESVLIEEIDSSMPILDELRDHGLRLVLDDFGTGYSSLSYLMRFPLDGVKVDRSFIDGLDRAPQNAAIMKAIVEMCHALRLSVVAEGVESERQLKQVGELGYEYAQGYLLCHPMPADEVGEFLEGRLASQTIDTVSGARAVAVRV